MNIELDFSKPPRLSIDELDRLYTVDTLYIISEIMQNKRDFMTILQNLIDIMKYGYEITKVRKRPTQYKFTKDDDTIKQCQLNHFISNLIFWKPLIDIDRVDVLDDSWVFDFSTFNTDTLMDYVNKKLLKIYNTDFASQNYMVDELYHNIISISRAFAPLMGMSITLYDLHQLELRNPRVSQIMRDPIDASLQPHEVEVLLQKNNAELIKILINDVEMNDYKPFFASKSCLKENQFKEFVVRIGFKSDINGNTVPILIDNNFLIHGLSKASYIYLNAISGRKALILSKLAIAKPGAFAKKLTYQATTSVLRQDYEMCDSVTTIEYNIKNDKLLEMLHGRYYYTSSGEMKLLDYEVDKHLIGKIVRFRSPVTCNSKEGVCKYCYGHLFTINQSLASAGCLAAIKVTGPVGQKVLGSKHSQTTESNDLVFSDGFDEVFEFSNSNISLKEESDLEAELSIKLNDVQVEEMDDSDFYSVESFEIVDSNNKTIHVIKEEAGARFYLNEILVRMYQAKNKNKSTTIIPLEDVSDEAELFTVEVKNKELTEPLKIILKVLNSNEHGGAKTLSEFCQIYGEKMLSIGIAFEFVHTEMIARSLIKKKSNIFEFPEFGIDGNPSDYQILKLNDAQMYHPSALVSLPYGYIRRQLLSTELYEKTSAGPLDPLYVSSLSAVM